jgi:hypothetical protein
LKVIRRNHIDHIYVNRQGLFTNPANPLLKVVLLTA